MEVKNWLRRRCLLRPELCTRLDHLLEAYQMMGEAKRRSPAEFTRAIVERCPGLRKTMVRGQIVIQGVAPDWSQDQALLRMLQRSRKQ